MPIRTANGIKLTYEDYLLIPEDGRRHEILDGEHIVSATSLVRHQLVLGELLVQLHAQVTAPGHGKVLPAPFDVELTQVDVLQPDLVMVLDPGLARIGRTHLVGSPDLVIEILSASSRRLDRVRKKERYRLARVPEYWVVDPEAETVEQYVLEDGEYQTAGTWHDRIEFKGMSGVSVDLVPVWRRSAG